MISIKNYLGYDRLEINVPKEEVVINNDQLEGRLNILSKVNSEIQSIEIEVWEFYQRGWWKYKETEKLCLGTNSYHQIIPLVKEKSYEIKFSVEFTKYTSKIERKTLQSQLFKPLINGIKIMGNVYSDFELITKVKLKGSPLKAISKTKLSF